MDVPRNHMTERILNLTLEIIYLLTGEVYTITKTTSVESERPDICPSVSEEQNRTQNVITAPPPDSLTDNDQKILELTNKILHLLTGEEWEYIDGHQDLYKDVKMEDQDDRTLTSLDGSSNSPERRPRLLSSQDSTQEDLRTSQEHQSEDLTVIKVEDVEEEETCMMGDPLCKEEEIPTDICPADGCSSGYSSRKHVMFPPDCTIEDNEIREDSPGEDVTTSNTLPGLPSSIILCIPANQHLIINQTTYTDNKPFSCDKCGKGFSWKKDLITHERVHTGVKPFSCSECGKCFTQKSSLNVHKRLHTGEKPFSSSECWKGFTYRSKLKHPRIRTGEKPFKCPECGKCFTKKSHVITHQRTHAEEKPISCPDCGKYFTQKSSLNEHKRLHTGEKPFACPVCGKRFTKKSHVITHQSIHTGEKPYSCPDCGKCYTQKSNLTRHLRSHTTDNAFSHPHTGLHNNEDNFCGV